MSEKMWGMLEKVLIMSLFVHMLMVLLLLFSQAVWQQLCPLSGSLQNLKSKAKVGQLTSLFFVYRL